MSRPADSVVVALLVVVCLLLAALPASAVPTCCATQATPSGDFEAGSPCTPAYSGMVGSRPELKTSQTACLANGGLAFLLFLDCVPVTGAGGDPHITGFDGSIYLLWGKPNATYNLLSERSHHVNIHLYHPPGRVEAHALYIDSVGIMINEARIGVQLVPGPAASMVLSINGEEASWAGHPVERAVDAHTAFAFTSADRVVITSTEVTLAVVLLDDDHLDVHVEEVTAHWGDVHGVLGQSHKAAFTQKFNYATGMAVGDLPTSNVRAKKSKKELALQGVEDDYITSGLFKADDKFSRFQHLALGAALSVTRKILGGHIVAKLRCDAGVAAVAAVRGADRLLLTDTYECM